MSLLRVLVATACLFTGGAAADAMSTAVVSPEPAHGPAPFDAHGSALLAESIVILAPGTDGRFVVEESLRGALAVGDSIAVSSAPLTNAEPMACIAFLRVSPAFPGTFEIVGGGAGRLGVSAQSARADLHAVGLDAAQFRAAWDIAVAAPAGKARIEALWPMFCGESSLVQQRALAEFRALGPEAGDYIAAQLPGMTHAQRMAAMMETGGYASEALRAAMLANLRKQQAAFESGDATHDAAPDSERAIGLPAAQAAAASELYYGLTGLYQFHNTADLPYIRDLARWAAANRLEQICAAAFEAFKAMPDRDNLPAIDAVRTAFAGVSPQYLTAPAILATLGAHRYPETFLLVAPYLDAQDSAGDARQRLASIAGVDLGDGIDAWLDWYERNK